MDARKKSKNRYTANSKAQKAQRVVQKRMPFEMRDRLVEPDYLCFLTSDGHIELRKVADWKSQSYKVTLQNGERAARTAAGTFTSYVFVSFTGDQFFHPRP